MTVTLDIVQGSMRLESNAAASFRRVDAGFGGRLVITSPYGAHRSEHEQQYLRTGYERRMAGWKGYSHFNYAAPARTSNHEGVAPLWEGFAVDISNYRDFPGLHAAMIAEGWARDPVELWHYNYRGRRTHTVVVAGNLVPIKPEPPKRKKLPMTVGHIKDSRGKTVYAVDLADGAAPLRAIGEAEWGLGAAQGIVTTFPDPDDFDNLHIERGNLLVDADLRPRKYDPALDAEAGTHIVWRGLDAVRPNRPAK